MKGNYTEKEIALLKEHTNQIVRFLVPLKKEIRSYHEIRFGDKCGHFGDYEYRLSFNPNWIYGGMGRCSIALEENCPSCDYTLDDSYSAPDFMAKLCRDWKTIKSQVMEYVTQERILTKSITDFEL